MYNAIRNALITITFCILLNDTATATEESNYYSHPFILGVGVHSGQGRAPFSKGAPVLEYAGITSVRQEASWSRIETQKGELKYPDNLRDVEAYIDSSSKRGGQPLLILNYGNKFYDEGDGVYSDEGIAGFARYATFIATHFKGRVKFYDVWNEWEIGLGSNKNPRTIRSVDTYIKLLQATYTAIKKVDPQAVVLGPVATTTHAEWIDSFINAGGLNYLDGFSTHPYLMWNIKSKPENSITLIDNLHKKIENSLPKRKIPIYITEIGWPNHRGPISWTQQQTADFLIRFLVQARMRPYIGGIWWYSLANDGREDDDKEKTFGIVDYYYKPKPALEAFKVSSTLISQWRSARIYPGDAPQENRMDITLKSGALCSIHWLTSGTSTPIGQPSGYKETNSSILWGAPSKLSETPFIWCQ